MHHKYFSPKLNLKNQRKSVENNYSVRKQKSLKDLILTKPKHNMIDKIQSKLSFTHDLKILDRTLFYLACYITHYQSLYNIINKGLNNAQVSFNNFKNNQSQIIIRKNQQNIEQKERIIERRTRLTHKNQQKPYNTQKYHLPCHQITPKRSKPQIISHTERSNHQSPDVKVIMNSYRYKCLKEFFHLQKYSQTNILQTAFNKIHQKIVKNQIQTIESYHAVSIKRISINYHKRKPSHPKNNDETSKTNKNKTLLPEIQSPKFHLKKKNKEMMKKTGRFDNIEDLQQKSKATPTMKSFKSESRRNGIHEVNTILMKIQELKQALNCSFLEGDQVTNIASDIKLRLNNLLNHLKVKPVNTESKTKQSQFMKVR